MANSQTDYYNVLGINKSASAEEIKKAYRKQALEWHPDRHKNDKETAEKKFKEINEAYQVLSNPQKKSHYDQFGSAGPGPQNPFSGGQSGQYGPFTYTYSTSEGNPSAGPFGNMDFGDPFEIFNQFFGGGFSGARVPTYSIGIDFMEAVEGVEKEVDIEGKRRIIKIPAGVDNGSRINFKDFILSISVAPHNIFEREGADIYVKVTIPYSLAALGGNISVPTPEGEIKLKLRNGVQSGSTMRLRGKGIRHLRGRGKGDEYVRLVVQVPEKLSRDQKRVIEGLQEAGL